MISRTACALIFGGKESLILEIQNNYDTPIDEFYFDIEKKIVFPNDFLHSGAGNNPQEILLARSFCPDGIIDTPVSVPSAAILMKKELAPEKTTNESTVPNNQREER